MPLTVRLSVDWDPTDLMGLITSLTFNCNKKHGKKSPGEILQKFHHTHSWTYTCIHPHTPNAHVNNIHPHTPTHMVRINIRDTRHKSLKIFHFKSPKRAKSVSSSERGDNESRRSEIWPQIRPKHSSNYTIILHLTPPMTSTNYHEIP